MEADESKFIRGESMDAALPIRGQSPLLHYIIIAPFHMTILKPKV